MNTLTYMYFVSLRSLAINIATIHHNNNLNTVTQNINAPGLSEFSRTNVEEIGKILIF